MITRRGLSYRWPLFAVVFSSLVLVGACGQAESPPPTKVESAPAAAQKPEAAAPSIQTASAAPSTAEAAGATGVVHS